MNLNFYATSVLSSLLSDNSFKEGVYKIIDNSSKDKRAIAKFTYYFSIQKGQYIVRYYYLEENMNAEKIIKGILDKIYIIEDNIEKFFYCIYEDLSIKKAKESQFSAEEIKQLKDNHNYFDAEEYDPNELAISFAQHVKNNKLNLLSTFYPPKKLRH